MMTRVAIRNVMRHRLRTAFTVLALSIAVALLADMLMLSRGMEKTFSRVMSSVGLVNQRYLITLAANSRILEVSSNHERVKASVPFEAQPNVWYRLKTRVDPDNSGGGFVRAKLWERASPSPRNGRSKSARTNCMTMAHPACLPFHPRA